MSTGLHKEQPADEVHGPYRKLFANAAARTGDAGPYTAADVTNRIKALQTDTLAEYVLTAVTPTWTALGGGGGGGQTNTVVGSNGITNVGDNVDADLAPTYGTGAGTVCEGNDSRLSDARTPTAHAASHTDGSDDIQSATNAQKGLATAAQITSLESALQADGSVAWTGDQDAGGNGINNLDHARLSSALAAQSLLANQTLDFTSVQTIRLNVDTDLGVTIVRPAGGGVCRLFLVQDGGGNSIQSWALTGGTVLKTGSQAPDANTVNGNETVMSLIFDGTTVVLTDPLGPISNV